MICPESMPARHRIFKLVLVPLLFFSLLGQLAVIWTQLPDMRDGYFDFALYYSAARVINDGNGARLYELEMQRQYQKSFRPAGSDRDLPFNHAPYELLPLLIPAKFSFLVAHLLWSAFNIALLVMILVRIFQFVEPQQRALSALMLLAFFPTLTALKMGQDSIITTYLLVETFVTLKRKQFAKAGGLLALGLYKPQFVLPVIGILALRRKWQCVIGFATVGLLLGAISLAMVGWNGLSGLLSLWLPMTRRGHVVWPELMTNLRGLIYVVLDLLNFSALTNTLTLVFSVVVYGMAIRLWSGDTERAELLDLSFALTLVATALVSFHLYSYDGMLLIIPLIIMANQLLKDPGSHPIKERVFLTVLFALFFPLVPNLLLSTGLLAWWALPLPVLFGIIAITLWRRSHAESSATGSVAFSVRAGASRV
jgi:glycosyl transferase family 87